MSTRLPLDAWRRVGALASAHFSLAFEKGILSSFVKPKKARLTRGRELSTARGVGPLGVGRLGISIDSIQRFSPGPGILSEAWGAAFPAHA